MASALRRGSPRNNPAASAPAVENDIAPKIPAKIRQSVCHHSAAFNPVANSASVVVISPKANRRDGEIVLISSIVRTAPPIYPSALAVFSHPAWA